MSNLFIELYRMRHVLILVVLASFVVLPVAAVWASKGDLASIDQVEDRVEPPLYVTLGKAELVGIEGDVADVLVANSDVIDVMAVQSGKLYIVGVTVGDTNLIALDAQGEVLKRIDVHVTYDLQAIQSLIDSLFPEESVKISSIHDQILLTGSVSTPEAASKIASIVGSYVGDLQNDAGSIDELISNLLEVRGEQQVMLQVKIVEATRNVVRELGVDTSFNNQLTSAKGDGSAITLTPGSGNALSQDEIGTAAFLFGTGMDMLGGMQVMLAALEEEGLANILAEPNLTAVSGETAGFLAGGEFPVPTGRDQQGNIVVEFREFGVSLNFRPIVLSDKRISLQMNTEVSSIDFDNAVVLADLTVPGRDIRRTETTVEVASGASLMISGLLKSESVKGMKGLPGINKTPVLGDLVSSDSFSRNETELVVVVTPYLVEPYEETERADPIPVQENNPLARVFAMNIRRAFDLDDEDEAMFDMDEKFGYLLD